MPSKSNTQEFITKAKEVHGEKYDYSKVDYHGRDIKVCIICPEHGEFWQSPHNHLKGCNCPKCAGFLVRNKEDFVKKASEIHNGKYSYEKTVYSRTSDNVCITCPKHGDFWMMPLNHLKGQGCRKCSNEKLSNERSLTKEEFIERAKAVHGDKYSYDKVEYVNMYTKVCITCPTHGDFWMQPNNHISGQGCKYCGKENKRVYYSAEKKVNKNKLTNNEKLLQKDDVKAPAPYNEVSKQDYFITKAKEIHGDKFDYSKVSYKNQSTKVCIICPKHGEFWQAPGKHLSGQQCPVCSGRKSMTTDEFINKARQIHGDKYDYSQVEYTTLNTKVHIICPKHGDFWMAPEKHLIGEMCVKCRKDMAKEKCSARVDEFIEKSKALFGDKFDYGRTKIEYVNKNTPVTITCKEHGDFKQLPVVHLNSLFGCPICAQNARNLKLSKTTEQFIKEANEVHNHVYDYSETEYISEYDKVRVICHKTFYNGVEHGAFYVQPNKHLQRGTGCPHCSSATSKGEGAIYKLVCEMIGSEKVKHRDRKTIHPYEIDILIPSKNFAIEYDGLFWHNEERCGCEKLLDKTIKSDLKGVKLIHIFEDEWLSSPESVIDYITRTLTPEKIQEVDVTQCTVKNVNEIEAREFLQKNSTSQFIDGTTFYGCYLNEEVVAITVFKQTTATTWVVTLYEEKNGINIRNGFDTIFKIFFKELNPVEVEGFLDRRWYSIKEKNYFDNAGFEYIETTYPDYYYVDIRKSAKKRILKNILEKREHDKQYDELFINGNLNTKRVKRIRDCGYIKYVWKNK